MSKKRKKLKGIAGAVIGAQPAAPVRSDVPIATREPVHFWERLPQMGPEDILPPHVRESRARAWRNAHRSTFAVRCADAWPPIRLDECDFGPLFDAQGVDCERN